MNKLTFVLVNVMTLATLIGANVYLSHRFSVFFPSIKTRYFYLVFFGITLIPLFLLHPAASGNIFCGIVYSVTSVLIGVLLYLFMFTLVLDVSNIFLKWPSRIIGWSALGLAGVVSLYGIVMSYTFRTVQHTFQIDGLKESIKIGHISDVHMGYFRGKNYFQRLVSKCMEMKPDVVFITGDIVDSAIQSNRGSFSPLKDITVPVFFVDGNHDHYAGMEKVESLLKEFGVRQLKNEVVDFRGIQLVGLKYMNADHSTYDMHATGQETISDVLPKLKIDPDRPSILLHHSPEGVQYASEKGIDLILCGHTHAGQVFPMNLISQITFSYNQGIHQYQGTTIFVSQGAGTFGPPMRVGTSNEIAFFTLTGTE